jgi:hypothetical protein
MNVSVTDGNREVTYATRSGASTPSAEIDASEVTEREKSIPVP